MIAGLVGGLEVRRGAGDTDLGGSTEASNRKSAEVGAGAGAGVVGVVAGEEINESNPLCCGFIGF